VAGFDPATLASSKPVSLYVHLPFCRSKCPYCDFFSVPCDRNEDIERVVDDILEEMGWFARLLLPSTVPTVYVGGGTPSLLPPHSLERLLAGIRAFAPEPEEWTVEANPESLTVAFLQTCARQGVGRLSLGVQSTRDRLLRVLGRPGDESDNRAALARIRSFWRGRLNLDFLVGVPGQSRADLFGDLLQARQTGAGHVSLYALTPPPGTALAKAVQEDARDELWLAGFEQLEAQGYRNYEVANFARPGEECLHNLRYWRLLPYLGVGPGAVSTLPGAGGEVFRLYHAEDVTAYRAGNPWGLRQEMIRPKEFLLETLMMGFRLRRGIDAEEFSRRFGRPLPELLPVAWREWEQRGCLREDPEVYAFTDQGRLLLNRRLLEAQQALEALTGLQVRWPTEG
jgi:putative oxygen-independent coproporphyrinogen III oxidase